MTGTDWNPETYARFRDLRLRPALDLLTRVPPLPDGPVMDLGCGAGAVGPALATRFAGRRIDGLDASPAMLGKARATGCYSALELDDAALWQPDTPPALIFSNAALHWLADHDRLLPRLAGLLAPGGVLAVQMPRQWDQPSHRLLRDTAARLFADRFDFAAWTAPVQPPEAYCHLLAPLGDVAVWETCYIQRLGADGPGHPVRRFTESTAARPLLDRLSPSEAARFLAAYDAALAKAYPPESDGAVLFPFCRVFFTLIPTP